MYIARMYCPTQEREQSRANESSTATLRLRRDHPSPATLRKSRSFLISLPPITFAHSHCYFVLTALFCGYDLNYSDENNGSWE
ncbi:hypothetical protein J6590_060293 [Homalodisca vitripennis]|nr:hypothetical protein J6590_060293 [Homalodisca vitripennis]